MMMKIKAMLIGFASFLTTGVIAQTVATTATEGAAVRETSIVKNQSKYASQSDRSFTIVRVYDFDVLGGQTAALDLDPNADLKDLPDNSIITEVVVDIIEAVLPTNATPSTLDVGALEVFSSTAFGAAATLANRDADAVIGKTTAADEVSFDAVTAPTQGYFTVTLSGFQGQ